MENLTNIQLIAGAIAIVLTAFSIVGWCGIIANGVTITPAEQAELKKEHK